MQYDEQFHAAFFDEAGDHVKTLEARLLELEANPTDAELLNALFRAAHSVKGASGMLGFDTLAGLTHAMESVLEALRSYRIESTPLVASTLLDATDMLGRCLEAAQSGTESPDISSLVTRLNGLSGAASKTAEKGPAVAEAARERTIVVTFRPPREIFALGLDPSLCVRELLELGKGQVTVLADALPPLESLDPEQCYLGWRVELLTSAPVQQLRDVFMFVDNPIELTFVEPRAANAEAREPKDGAPPAAKRAAEQATLRVNTSKVDRLINLVGELVIAQAMVSRSLADFTPEELPRLRAAALEESNGATHQRPARRGDEYSHGAHRHHLWALPPLGSRCGRSGGQRNCPRSER